MNNNLLLYGSFSRGDYTQDSDVDLLTVIDGYSYKSTYNKINISYYNKAKLTEMSTSGSLFLFHLNREAKILIDEGKTLSEIIFEKFSLRNDYNEDIYFAKSLLMEIYRLYDNTNHYSYANSKVSWCLRTFYSGLGANNKESLFSREKIARFFGKESEKYLAIKNSETYQKRLVSKIIEHTDNYLNMNEIEIKSFRQDLQNYKVEVLNGLRKPHNGENVGY